VTAFALMSIFSWGVLKLADPVCKILGATGIDAMTRLMGFLLVCMGMQFCINGIKEVAQDPVFHGAPAAQTTQALPHVSGAFELLEDTRRP
jgi:multiple antibiotic resistance protein